MTGSAGGMVTWTASPCLAASEETPSSDFLHDLPQVEQLHLFHFTVPDSIFARSSRSVINRARRSLSLVMISRNLTCVS